MNRHDYGSIDELVSLSREAHRNCNIAGNVAYLMESDSQPHNWRCGKTMSTARDSASSPAADALQLIEEFSKRITGLVDAPPTNRRKRISRQDHGSELDPDIAIMRRADAWEDIRSVKRPALRTVRIGIDINAKACDTREESLNRGAACCAVMDALQGIGCDVELVAYVLCGESSNLTHRGEYLHTITIKRPDMPTDPGAIIVAACEIWFMRLVVVPMIYRHFHYKTGASGWSIASAEATIRAECDICIPRDIKTAQAAERFIRYELERFQCPA